MLAKLDIKSLTTDELAAQLAAWGEKAYRVKQILDWLYVHHVATWDEMSNLSKPLREKLAATFTLQPLELIRKQGARDTTQKFLWRLADHSLIESVLIPASPSFYGEVSDRHTLCISTQVGCAYGCKFCASGLDGWKRNLTPHEIVEQVMAVERWNEEQSKVSSLKSKAEGQPTGEVALAAVRTSDLRLQTSDSKPPIQDSRLIDNIVVMGMGEPLANYDNLLKALRILNAPWGGRLGARKITISTSGLAPQIRKLADEPEQWDPLESTCRHASLSIL